MTIDTDTPGVQQSAREYDYRRYLEAKRSVDDRALNRQVIDALRSNLPARPLRVLELGGGTGSMWRRRSEWQLFDVESYTLVDIDGEALTHLQQTLSDDDPVTTVERDIGNFLADSEVHPAEGYDLVLANAVFDLLELDEILPLLLARCAGHLWATINFDGESTFIPARPEDLAIWQAYHDSMDRRPGSAHSGRKLVEALQGADVELVAGGSSDWFVHATQGAYLGDEAYFLHHIVHTIDQELAAAPPVVKAAFQRWVQKRHEDIDNGALVYIAHQLDLLASLAAPTR